MKRLMDVGDFSRNLEKYQDKLSTFSFAMFRNKTSWWPKITQKHDLTQWIYEHRLQDFRRPLTLRVLTGGLLSDRAQGQQLGKQTGIAVLKSRATPCSNCSIVNPISNAFPGKSLKPRWNVRFLVTKQRRSSKLCRNQTFLSTPSWKTTKRRVRARSRQRI